MRKHQEPIPQAIPQRKKAKRRFSVTSIVRIGLQILFFIWLPSLYISAFAGLQELFTSIVTGTFSLTAIWPDLLALVAIVPSTIFAGRFFCGWMCAFGALLDWIYRFFSRWTKNRIRISRKGDHILKGLKYVILAALLLLGWLAASFSVSIMSPWDTFGMLFTFGAAPALLIVLQSLLPGFIILILIFVASAFVERFFCRYLCPMGAFFALISGARIIVIDKPREKCGNCQICTKNCAMGIPLNQMDKVTSGECIGCMKCVDACPRKNVSVHADKTKINPIAIAIVMAALMAGLFLFSSFLLASANKSIEAASGSAATAATTAAGSAPAATSGQTTAGTTPAGSGTTGTAAPSETLSAASSAAAATAAATTAATTAATSAAAGLYKDGTYTGSGTGFRGTTTVKITVSGGKITNVSVISYQDDASYFNKAFSTISSNVVSAQSAAVDVVSHATYSSKGIIGAVKDALSQAK